MMQIRSLHARLAGTLLILLTVVGALTFYLTLDATELYLQEGTQGMHFDLAANIAAMKGDLFLDQNGAITIENTAELFHWMMVVNPGAQFYLLDSLGNVLDYDPMAGDITTDRVDLLPISTFLSHNGTFDRAVKGTDPRSPETDRIFSVAPLPASGTPIGYLYVVLESHGFQSTAELWRNSYILRLTTFNGAAILLVVLVLGWFLFGRLTKPLRRLAKRMHQFLPPTEDTPPVDDSIGDEIDRLDRAFDQMATRIDQQMAEIERMALARRELIANVSHDLRTPIALLRGYLETLSLKRQSLSRADREEYLHIAMRQAERLGTLVSELFELTGLDAHEVEANLEKFALTELIQDNVQRFQLTAEDKGVRLSADFDPDLPPVKADVGLMERALENLIGNAIRHTQEGGSVTVQLRDQPSSLDVKVIDTGSGIDPNDLPHIFDRYYTGSSRRGTGLGLAISQRIIQLHNSELDIRSGLGVGTTVSFSLETAPRAGAMPA